MLIMTYYDISINAMSSSIFNKLFVAVVALIQIKTKSI